MPVNTATNYEFCAWATTFLRKKFPNPPMNAEQVDDFMQSLGKLIHEFGIPRTQAAIDAWAMQGKWFPKSGDLFELLPKETFYADPDQQQGTSYVTPDCKICGGSGWQVLTTKSRAGNRQMKRCNCFLLNKVKGIKFPAQNQYGYDPLPPCGCDVYELNGEECPHGFRSAVGARRILYGQFLTRFQQKNK